MLNVKLPITIFEIENKYSDIDTLVYFNKIKLSERVQSKKNIIKVLMSENKIVTESINIPIKSMVSIANQTLRTYVDELDESTKKEFFKIISEDSKTLEVKFETIRENTINKLNSILEKEEEFELKTKISETIDRVRNEKFDQLTFLRLKNLENSI